MISPFLGFAGKNVFFTSGINTNAVIIIIRQYDYHSVVDITNSNMRYQKILPEIKENGKQVRLVLLVTGSLVTKYLWRHLYAKMINKLNSQLAWPVHTCHSEVKSKMNQSLE